MHFYNFDTGVDELPKRFHDVPFPATAYDLSRNEKVLAVGYLSPIGPRFPRPGVVVRDMSAGKDIAKWVWRNRDGRIQALAISPENRYLAVGLELFDLDKIKAARR